MPSAQTKVYSLTWRRSVSEESKANNLERVLDVKLSMVVKIGNLPMKLKDVLNLHPGSIMELENSADAPLPLTIGEKEIARGEVITIGESLGLRLMSAQE